LNEQDDGWMDGWELRNEKNELVRSYA